MIRTVKRAFRTYWAALMSLVVVSCAVLYVWLPEGRALTLSVTERSATAADATVATVNGERDGAGPVAAGEGAEIVYGRVSGPDVPLVRDTAVLSCPGLGSIIRNFGRRGGLRKVLHRKRETCALVLRADFGGRWYSARGALMLRPGHAYYIDAKLADTRLVGAFPVETY